MNELQILRDEFDIDQTAGRVFQIPDIGVAFFLGDRAAHLDDVVGDRASIAFAAQHFADHGFDPGGESRRSGHDTRARQRHVFPGPGFVLLIAGKPADLRRQRPGAARGRSRIST